MFTTRMFVLTLIFSPLFSYAYEFTKDFNDGFYWASMPIKLTVSEANSEKKARLVSVTDAAIREWESVVGKTIWGEAELSGGRNIVRWSNDIGAETGFDNLSTYAVTLRYVEGPYYARTEILLNAQKYDLQFDAVLKAVILHELGHTLGLDHSANYSAVMFASYNGNNQLNSDDIAGVNAIVDETQRRAAIGFISPLAFKEKETVSCATLSDISSGPGQGPLSFAIGLILLFAIMAPAKLTKQNAQA